MGGMFRQYSWVVDLIGILFCSYFLAEMTGVYIGRSLEVRRSVGVLKPSEVARIEKEHVDLDAYRIITDRDIFDSSERRAKTSNEETDIVEEDAVYTGEAVLTSLRVPVLGVLVVGDGRDSRSSATIAEGESAETKARGGGRERAVGGGAKVYAVGDKESFAPNTMLVRIQPDRIEFMHGGRLEYAEVTREFGTDIFGPPSREPIAAVDVGEERDALIRSEAPGRFAVDRREVDNALQNLDRLYTEIRAVPNFSGGRVSGIKVLSVKSGSIFAKLGLRRGDVLQRINGMELDVKRGFEIFNKLKDESSISLDVVRQGQPTTMEYEIR